MLFLASVSPGLALAVGFAAIAAVLALVVVIVLVAVKALRKRNAAPIPAEEPEEAAEVEAPKPVAPGSAGQLKLHDVEPKTAAMLMAIVADKMGKPINELRFISIKEVK